MNEAEARSGSTHKRRRGVVRASITRIATRLRDLEGKTDQPGTLELVQRMPPKLEALDAEFKTHHYALLDFVDDPEAVSKEQETLDDHDDDVTLLAVRMQQLIAKCASSPDTNARKIVSRRLLLLQKNLSSVGEAIDELEEPSEVCLLRQHGEQLADIKKEMGEVRSSLLSLDLEEGDDLHSLQANLEKIQFDCSRKLLQSHGSNSTPHTPPDGKGVKLPKLEVATFNGNILSWRTFWEQFDVSVHSRSNLSDSEKLVYLQHALKDGSAKHVIEGLSRSGEYYAEAIECLQARYDRPRLIHQTRAHDTKSSQPQGGKWPRAASSTRYRATASSGPQSYGL